MDRETLLAHRAQMDARAAADAARPARLNDAERRFYDDLRWRRLRDDPLRLEQERISFATVAQATARLSS